MKKIILLVTVCLIICTSCIYAMPPSGIPSQTVNMTELESVGGKILGGINAVGYTVAIGVLMYIGIRLMIAAPSEKAQVKSVMVPYVVGAVVMIGSLSILNIIANIAEQITL